MLATESDVNTVGADRVRAIHGAKVGRVDENGNFSSDDTRATSGRDNDNKATDKDKSWKVTVTGAVEGQTLTVKSIALDPRGN